MCLEHLQHNNLLIKPLNGRKTEKVHKNLCKLAPFRNQHLRLSEDFSVSFPNYPRPAAPPVGHSGDPEPWDDDVQPHPPAGPLGLAPAGPNQPAHIQNPEINQDLDNNPPVDNQPVQENPPVDNQPVQENDHVIGDQPIQVQFPENVPVMGTPPPQPTPDTPEQEDSPASDPQGDNSSPVSYTHLTLPTTPYV